MNLSAFKRTQGGAGANMRVNLLSLLFTVLFSAVANAAQSGNWTVEYFPNTGESQGCIMSTDYRGGTRLSLIVYGDYSWGLGFYNPSWNLQKGGRTDVAAYIDGRLVATAKATHVTEQIAILPLERAETYRALQRGHGLTLKTPQGMLGFALDGTARAMEMVLDCVKSAPQKAATNDAVPANTSNSGPEPVTEAEAAIILSNLLNSASRTNFKIRPPTGQAGVASFSLQDGSHGFLIAWRGSAQGGADDASANVLSSDAATCEGNFRSGKQAIQSTDGSIVRKVVTSCQANNKTTVNETTIVRRSDGFLISLSHVFPEGLNTLHDVPTSDGGANQSGLTEAAMKFDAAR